MSESPKPPRNLFWVSCRLRAVAPLDHKVAVSKAAWHSMAPRIQTDGILRIMTVVPEEPTPLTDEALRLIGAIAVEAARLEWQLAGLRSVVDTSMTHEEALSVPHDRQVKEIRRHLEERRDEIIGVPEEITEWVSGALRLLKRRGDVMHSSWALGEAGVVESHHLKSGKREPVIPEMLADFAAELRQHVQMGVVLWLSAATWDQVEEAGPE
jgi:hypothetical protein